MQHKTLSLLLALLMSMTATLASAQQYDFFEVDGIYYSFIIKDFYGTPVKTVGVTFKGSSYYSEPNEYSGNIVIPESINFEGETYKVTAIGNEAFRGCSNLASVTIPNTVTSIGEFAFEGCSGLTSITIPSSVTSISGYTFLNCTSLSSVTIPNSVTSIGDGAFGNCQELINIKIPDSVTSIGREAFYGNLCLAYIYNSNVFAYLNPLYSKSSFSIPEGIKTIASSAFLDCSKQTAINIPSSVTWIGESAFKNCSGLTSITIPENVSYIGDEAFMDCSSLTAITIPNSVTYISENAFAHCSSLASVTIPNSVTSIIYGTFRGCSGLTSLTIPENVTYIGEAAFSQCSGLTSLTISSGVTRIGNYAFYGCPLKKILNYAETPQTCGEDNAYVNYEAFDIDKSTCELYVPAGSVELYKKHIDWKDFNVKAMDDVMLGIEGLTSARPQSASASGIYDLNGRSLPDNSTLKKGVYVVNGRKVLIK